MTIACIDIAPLFDRASTQRAATDAAILAAATGTGFMTVTGLPTEIAPVRAVRQDLLRLLSLSEADKRKLLRQSFDPAQPNLYRGFFPLQTGGPTYKEGIDIGPDVADPTWRPDPNDPLTEATPLPDEATLPGWRADAARYYRGMEHLGAVMMRSLARGLGHAETTFDAAFVGGISTLRLIRYPERTPETLIGADPDAVAVMHDGVRRHQIGSAHVDSGFVTLLAQDGVEGLQAEARDGRWIDVPPVEGALAVNFGGLLERWTGGRIRATKHRVLSPGCERYSIPFFFEPRVAAVIAPLAGGPQFVPFTYGDHLWSAMTEFVEFRDLKGRRRPRGVTASH